MTRDELTLQISGFVLAISEQWGAVEGDEVLSGHWARLSTLLPKAMTDDGAAAPLLKGEPQTSLFALPPETSADIVAAVQVSVNESGEAGRAEMVLYPGVSDSAADESPYVCVRFESPEVMFYPDEESNEGVHDYHHSQTSGSIRGSFQPKGFSLPAWYPQSDLAIPVPACDPLDLILCAVLSVRHPRFVRQLAKKSGRVVFERIERLLVETGAIQPDPSS